MWKDKWNTAIFHMVFGKNTLNSKGIKNSKAKISHEDVPHEIFCAYWFYLHYFAYPKAKNHMEHSYFHMVFGQNTIDCKGSKKNKAKLSHMDVPQKIFCAY